MVGKGLKAAQIIAAALWGINLVAALLITETQDVLAPLLLSAPACAEKVIAVPEIGGTAVSAVLGIVSALIVCRSKVRHTRLKSVLLAVVQALCAPVSVLSSSLFTMSVAYQHGVEYLARYSALARLFNLSSLVFAAPAAILFIFSLGRYFDAKKRCEAAE